MQKAALSMQYTLKGLFLNDYKMLILRWQSW